MIPAIDDEINRGSFLNQDRWEFDEEIRKVEIKTNKIRKIWGKR